MNRAYSIFTIKRVDEDKRIISGIATTPDVDRMGDIVEPLGAEFKLPIPFLLQHDSSKPIGHVTKAQVTKGGISVEIQLANIPDAGPVKDRVDGAWQDIKHGLVKGLSVGFSSVETAYNKTTGGMHFLKWKWLELSAVTIAANAEASITTIKAAATGRTKPAPGDTGPTEKTQTMKTFAQQIANLEAEIGPKRLRMKSILEAVGDGDLDESDAEEFDGLADEVKTMETKLRRVKAMDATAVTARPVDGDNSDAGTRSRTTVAAEPKEHAEKGIGFARMAMCLTAAKGDPFRAMEFAKAHYPREAGIARLLQVKANIPGGTTQDPTWASPLVYADNLVSEFVEYLRPQTLVGRFGQGNIPSLRRVPFNISMPAQTSGGDGYWVGEGAPKPLTKFDYSRITLGFTKVANIAVLTQELMRFSNPSAELVVRDALRDALVARLDSDFANPAITVQAGIRPASILNGAATSPATNGDSAESVRADIREAISYFIANNIDVSTLVVLMRSSQAFSLSLMRSALGVKEFPGMTMSGGELEGIPVLASQYIPTGIVAFVSANNIFLADDGGVDIQLSNEASLEMLSSSLTQSVNDGGSPEAATGASLVSMFQTNSVAIRAERFINWQRRRTTAVYYFTATAWGDASSPFTPI